jgi:hypothetical protein
MNSHLLVSHACIFLVFLMSVGCNSAYRRLIHLAEHAADRGDVTTAAHTYRSACVLEPDDKKACGQALVFARKVADLAAEQARPACEAGEFDRCLAPLLKAQELIADHPAVTTLIEKASRIHAKRCAEWQMEGPLNMALAGLACLQARANQFPFPYYKSLITKSSNELSRRFVELAGVADNQATSGAAAVLWSAAQCLSPAEDTAWRAQKAHKDFLDSSGIPVIISLGGTIPPEITDQISDLCPHISSTLPAWSQCMMGGTAPGQREVLHLDIDAVIQGLQESVETKWYSTKIVSGIVSEENPEYALALRRRDSAKAALDQAASECSNSKALSLVKCKGCPLPPEKAPCTQEAAENYRRKEADYKSAKDRLVSTPETKERKILQDFPYSVSTYTWKSDFYFTIKANTLGGRVLPRHSGAVSFQDMQHIGDERAKLKVDPLERPSNDAFAKAVLERLTPQVIAAVQKDGERRSSTRRAQCKALPADWNISWVQCWAEATLWESGKEPAANSFLQLLASNAGMAHPVKCR